MRNFDLLNWQKISVNNREKKYQLFMRLFKPTANDKILDVGYINEPELNQYQNYLEKRYPYLNNITALGIQDFAPIQVYHKDVRNIMGGFNVIKYDGKIFPFRDKSFEIGYSNAVIEHVGYKNAQILFVKEMSRVCDRFFLTTPNRLFPIETHTKYPFINYLPDNLFRKILSKTKKKYWATNLWLLSENTLREILNEAGLDGKFRIHKQRFFGFTMTFSVEINNRVEVI